MTISLDPATRLGPAARPAPAPAAGRRTRPAGVGSTDRAAATRASAASGELLPLSTRVAALMALRVLVAVVLAALGIVGGAVAPAAAGGFLLGAGVLSLAVVRLSRRGLAIFGFGVLLMADSLAVVGVLQAAGDQPGLDLVLALHVASVCLLASFRTGIKIALWLSLLVVARAEAIGLGLLEGPDDGHLRRLALIWVLTLVVCQAASLNERELRRRRHDAEALHRFAIGLHVDTQVETVLGRLCDFLVDQADARRVLVCTRIDGRLEVLAERGTAGHLAPAPAVSDEAAGVGAGSPLLDRASDPASPALVAGLDPATEPELDSLLPDARRLVALPLNGEGEPGVWLVLEHEARGGLVERRVLSTIGQAVGGARLALSRARLYHSAQLAAHTDGLTGVANRRAFDDEIAFLCRSETLPSLGLLMVDVDHFKSINDRHGHQTGDVALQQIAATLVAHAPRGAVVARYGGEEFAVLLPRADAERAVVVAERLRTAVGALSDPVSMTASIGAASVTVPTSPAGLVSSADRALYLAKNSGRDRVVLATPALPGPVPSAIA